MRTSSRTCANTKEYGPSPQAAKDGFTGRLPKNYGTLADEAGGWNEKEVWKALRQFIADEISVDPGKITRDTTFPEGLNIF